MYINLKSALLNMRELPDLSITN